MFVLSVLMAAIIHSCVPESSKEITEVNISATDPEIRNISDLQDKQDVKGLYKYFRHKNPSYRYRAVIAFASIRKAEAGDSLVNMLSDPAIKVRAAAAYALGQTGEAKYTDRLIAAFRGKDTLDINNEFNASVLEAVGKTGSLPDLRLISTVRTYRNSDTLLLLGQVRAIYRMALRNITCDEGTSRMVELLYADMVPYEVKLLAANYMARAKDLNLSLSKVRLTDIFSRERKPEIRMALATAFGKSKDSDFIAPLKTAMVAENDYRVKCNILRALGAFPYAEIRDIALAHLKDENLHVAATAAGIFQTNGIVEDVPEYMKYDTVGIPWQVRSKMNGAVLTHTALYFTKLKSAFTERIIKNMKDAPGVYAKAAYLDAIGKDPFNYPVLVQAYSRETDQLLKISCIEGLGSILKNENFFRAFGNGFGQVKSEILGVLITAVNSGDAGQIATAAAILREPALQWKEWLKDLAFMKDAASRLKLPRDVEAYNELQHTISYLEGRENFKAESIPHNHPIDWSVIEATGDSSIAAIKTEKGVIRVRLFRDQAPGTVANFVDLINKKFYNDKVFHRVVPNFVVQTGCPRGDGYGSLDYTIRSELPATYYDSEGYIGMASAGNHTESTQWFITHSPTPHLDGNYTIFGKVLEGMDVVHKIQIGDKITEIIFVK